MDSSSTNLAVSKNSSTPDQKAKHVDAEMEILAQEFGRSGVFGLLSRGALQFTIMALVLIGASFLMQQLMGSREERQERVQKETVFTVATAVAQAADNQPLVSVFGAVEAARTLNLTSLVPGEVVEVNSAVRLGGRVSAGDVLIRIEPFDFEIALSEARANLNEAKALLAESQARLSMEKTMLERTSEQLALGEIDLDRARRLLEQGALTQRLVEERELILSQRQAAFENAAANIAIQNAQIEARAATVSRWNVQVRNAERSLAETMLRAPFDGVVQALNVEIGQTVTTTQSLITLYEANTLDVRFVLSDNQYGRLIRDGASAIGREIDVLWRVGETTRTYQAVIDRVAPEIAAERGGIAVFGRLQSQGGREQLRPGAFVTVNVPDQVFEESFRLPETAVFDGSLVYVVNDENRLEARKVEVLVYDRGNVIVRGGLVNGDIVTVTQIAEIGEGLLVRMDDDDNAPASDATLSEHPEGPPVAGSRS